MSHSSRSSRIRVLEFLDRPALWKQALLIFSVALAIRGGIVLATRQYLEMNRFELVRVALSMAETGTLANPWMEPTGPTAHVMPVYPLMLAAVFRVFGTAVTGEIVKEFLTCALSSAQWALIPMLAACFGLPRRAMLLAGITGALLPVKWRVDTLGDWEAVVAAVALLALSALTVWIWREKRFEWRQAIGAGVAWGLGILTSASFLAAAVVVVFAGLWYFRGRDRVAWLWFSMLAGLAAGVVLSPWIIRNAIVMGAPLVTRSSFGIVLFSSFNDGSPAQQQPVAEGTQDTWKRYDPMYSEVEIAEVRKYGEVEYSRRKAASAKVWIAAHPRRTVELIAARFADYWFPVTRSRARAALWALLTVAGYGAAPLVWRASRATTIVFGAIMVGYSPVYFLEVSDARYKYPIDWMIFVGIGMLGAYLMSGRLKATNA
jgi:hypothetical protein